MIKFKPAENRLKVDNGDPLWQWQSVPEHLSEILPDKSQVTSLFPEYTIEDTLGYFLSLIHISEPTRPY